MNEKLAFTKSLVYRAGEKIREMMQETIQIDEKTSASDLVTNVDKAIERMLVDAINERYSNQSFLTEENTVAMANTDDLWIIDPIDGTSNFIFQKDNFAISIAFYYQQKPCFGIVYEVMKDCMYTGEIGVGAFCNDVKLEQVNTKTTLSEVMLSGDVYRPDFFNLSPSELKPLFITHRFLGSGALETAMVASGRFGAYVFPKIKLWDIAAALIILECVGGVWKFGECDNCVVFDDQSRVFIAAQNEVIKDALVALL